jgi:hypothetical protein
MDQTICFLTIKNESTEGAAWFCADSDIVLKELGSSMEHKLLRSEGIPVCPDAHRFNAFAEELSFRLYFPALQNRESEIDLIEMCSDNCFSLKGIILDPNLNEEIRQFESAVELYKLGQKELALASFLPLLESGYKYENHYAYTHYIIPVIYLEIKENEKAAEYYQLLKNSEILKKDYFIGKLREFEFFMNLE